MTTNPCRFCNHGNPADAKFCSACGGQLNLAQCPQCGAVNDVVAATCYHCKSPMHGQEQEAPASAARAARISEPASRQNSRMLAGTVVLATMVALGYYGYTRFSTVAPAPALTVDSAATNRGGAAESGVIGRNTVAGDVAPAKAEVPARSASPAAVPSNVPTADPEIVAPVQSRAARRAADAREAREAKAASDIVAPSPAADAGKPAGQQPTRQEPCTAAAAALGLCVAKDVAGANARAQAGDTGKAAGGQEPPRQQACTEAVAALGLCTPGPK